MNHILLTTAAKYYFHAPYCCTGISEVTSMKKQAGKLPVTTTLR